MLRQACRTSIRDPLDFSVGIFRRVFSAGMLEANKKLAKSLGVTLHDLLLAATVQAFGATRREDCDTRRQAIAIGSAVDTRRFADESCRNGFGLLVGQYIVVERRPHEAALQKSVLELRGKRAG